MHLFYNGIGKKILNSIVKGPANLCKINQNQTLELQKLLDNISCEIPMEFQRTEFDLEHSGKWKATQHRFFLLYASGVILGEILDRNVYRHFLVLYTPVRILSSPKQAVEGAPVAQKHLLTFFQLMPTYYGESSQVINVHNLIHISDDVLRMNQSLDEFSAFPFENALGFLKTLLKSSTRPVSQIARRIDNLRQGKETSFPLVCPVRKQLEVPVVRKKETGLDKIIFETTKLRGMTLTATRPDNIAITNSGEIIKIEEMYITLVNGIPQGSIMIKGYKLPIIGGLFDYPKSSRKIGIYVVNNVEENLIHFPVNLICSKGIFFKIVDKFIVISLLYL